MDKTGLGERVAELPAYRKRELALLLSTPATFRKTYRNDCTAFAHDCVDWRGDKPTPYQDELWANVTIKRRCCVRSPHGAGKSAAAALVILWFALTRDSDTDWKVAITASAWRQLSLFLLPEVHKWARRLRWDRIHRSPFTGLELMVHSLRLSTGEAFAVASSDPAFIEGAHASEMMYVFDEAKVIPAAVFDAAEGAFSTGEAYALAISTPDVAEGRFYDIQSRKPGYEDWWVRHWSLEECLAAKRITLKWTEDRKRQWGEQSPVYQNRVLGQFATGASSSLIPLTWVEEANLRWEEQRQACGGQWTEPITAIGVDCAWTGEDKSVIATRRGNTISEIETFGQEDPMQVAGRAVRAVHGNKSIPILVDTIGIGAGTYARLCEMGYNAIAFNAAEKTDRVDISGEIGHLNTRSAAWYAMRELLDPLSGANVALPPDDMLTGDLTAPKNLPPTSAGKLHMESKEDLRKRIGRSTDSGDAVVQSFWSAGGGIAETEVIAGEDYRIE